MTTTNLATFENRIAQLEHQLHVGYDQGKLTRPELDQKQRELEQLRANLNRDAFDGGGLTAGDAKRASAALQKFTTGLRGDLTDLQENVDKRIHNLEARIQRGVRDGSLTQAEAKQLLGDVHALRNPEPGKNPGPFFQSLHDKLDGLEKKVHTERTDGQMNGGLRLDDFQRRIDAGVKDGSLTRGEAQDLTRSLDALREKGVTHLSAKDVNALNTQIFRLRHNVPVDLSNRFDATITKLDDAWSKGRITDAQGLRLANELTTAIERLSRGELTQATFGAELNRIIEKLGVEVAANRDRGQIVYQRQQAQRA